MTIDLVEGAPGRRSPSMAATLSFLWPGLGQWYLGRRRPALVYAVPVLAVVLAVAFRLLSGVETLAIEMFDPSFALTALILIVLLGVLRLAAILDAVGGIRSPHLHRRPRLAFVGALILLVTVIHGAAGYYAWSFYDAGNHIFVADPLPQPEPGATAGLTPDDFQATPLATPQTRTSRINILLTGIDSSEQRNHALTDTLIVVSIDPDARTVAMVSFPRDIARFPLSDGRTFEGKINSLMTYANLHPDEFPDGGLPTLMREVGHLLGVPIHYYAAVNLDGFQEMIDQVGGVTVVNERAIDDPSYGGWRDGRHGFYLSAGPHLLDGATALAYVRSRKGAGDNDFTRARRQQQLLVALRDKLADPAVLPALPDLLRAAGRTIKTNFPPDRLSEMLSLGRDVPESSIRRFVLGPPYATHPPTSSTGGTYILALDLDEVAHLSMELFGTDSRYAMQLGSP